MRRDYRKKGFAPPKKTQGSDGEEEDVKPEEGGGEEGAEKKPEPKKKKIELSKEQSYRVWDSLLRDVPTDYDFVITSNGERFPKGS